MNKRTLWIILIILVVVGLGAVIVYSVINDTTDQEVKNDVTDQEVKNDVTDQEIRNEILALVGDDRKYVTDEEWQSFVDYSVKFYKLVQVELIEADRTDLLGTKFVFGEPSNDLSSEDRDAMAKATNLAISNSNSEMKDFIYDKLPATLRKIRDGERLDDAQDFRRLINEYLDTNSAFPADAEVVRQVLDDSPGPGIAVAVDEVERFKYSIKDGLDTESDEIGVIHRTEITVNNAMPEVDELHIIWGANCRSDYSDSSTGNYTSQATNITVPTTELKFVVILGQERSGQPIRCLFS